MLITKLVVFVFFFLQLLDNNWSSITRVRLFFSLLPALPLLSLLTGYGFVDFDSPAAAQKAVASLKASGVQAQMAKVSVTPPLGLWLALPVVTEALGFHVAPY